jgi:flagellar export protein FliJ
MFRFRLQRVLDLRERKQRDAATALVSAQDEADQARDAALRLVEARSVLADTSATPSTQIGELRTLHFLLAQLDTHVATATTVATAAAETVAQREEELRAAFRERRTLDRLRERHEGDWRAAEAAADRQQMDEIALSRFTQSGAQSPGRPSSSAQTPTHES